MRLRKVKNALEKLRQNKTYFIDNPQEHIKEWEKVFGNSYPIHMEIGCGKGKFIYEMAKNNPNINYIAIEKYDSVLLRVLEKIENETIPNLKLVVLDASNLKNYFSSAEISRIYINFSDPWPKSAHQKRRLTYKSFLESYAYILKSEGEIFQKTDNRKLFEFSLQSFSEQGWILSNISLDLHKDALEDNIMTEFEEKWSKLGPIYRLEARKRR
ncbi:MAG: tRNA (guanosine(46)-N7)-methyltransferase TrmB [Acholeplasmatales bacterium]|jgi:tRNA (guanine-N7-)-methyltransferase|nr:tRNA (guanosine(46)-N7)-methyltransferase TrmB [Acholeplasmatales bacterium]